MSNHPRRRHRGRTEVHADQARLAGWRTHARAVSGTAKRRAKAIKRRAWVCAKTHPPESVTPGCQICEAVYQRIQEANRG